MSEVHCSSFLRAFGRERVLGEYGATSQSLGSLIYPIYQQAQSDDSAWYAGLSRCADIARSGWAWVGAARLVTEVGLDSLDSDERYKSIAEEALTFLRGRSIPRVYLIGYENQIWFQNHHDEEWISPLPGRPVPDAPVRPLEPGEEREVAVLPGLGNRLRVSQPGGDGDYLAYIYRVNSADDPTLARDEEPADRASSLSALYRLIAAGLGSPPPRFDPELEPFFVLPQPDFSP